MQSVYEKKEKKTFVKRLLSRVILIKLQSWNSWYLLVLRQKVLVIDKIAAKDLTNDLCCWFYNEEVDLNILKPFMDSACFDKLLKDVAANKEFILDL